MNMTPWIEYHQAVQAILGVIRNATPESNALLRRRIAEAEEIVEAVSDIIRLEAEDAAEDDIDSEGSSGEEFIDLKDDDA